MVLWLIPIATVFLLYEKKITKEDINRISVSSNKPTSSKCKLLCENLRILKEYLQQGFIFKPVLFIFLVLLNPSVDSVMFSYQAIRLKFSPTFISYISVATSISNIVAIFVYKRYLFNIELRKIIAFTTIGFWVFNALKLVIVFEINEEIGISNKVFYIISDWLYSFANEIHLMPIMIVACRICPKKVEATVFEFIMSIVNLGYLVSYQSGGFLADMLGITIEDFSNLWIQVLISSLFPLVVLSAIFIIPSDFSERVEAFSKKISREEHEKLSIFDRRGSDNLNESDVTHTN